MENNTFVVFDKTSCTPEIYEQYFKEKFDNKLFIFLGEVVNAPGHCILTDLSTGLIIGIYHTENFRVANETEI